MAFLTNRDGLQLFFHDWGNGVPLVFLHGGALNADCWEYQMVPLAEAGFRCIAADTRGCGRSDQPGYGYEFDHLADDLNDLITALQVEDVVLIGHSLAAGTITRYLTRHGARRIGKVVLISPTTPYLLEAADNPDGLPASMFEESATALRANRPAWIEASAPAFFGPANAGDPAAASLVQWAKGLALGSGGKATLEIFRNFYREDFRAELRGVTVPTLILHGDADISAPLELTGRPTAATIRASILNVYPGGSHGMFLTHADRVNGDISDFVRSTPGGG